MGLIRKLEFTFLSEEQVFEDELYILRKLDKKGEITDFSVLLGGATSKKYDNRCNGVWWTKSPFVDNNVCCVSNIGNSRYTNARVRDVGARPAIPYSSISSISSNKVENKSGVLEVEFGEYPQTIVDEKISKELELSYIYGKIKKTGKKYTVNSILPNLPYSKDTIKFYPTEHEEYEYNGKKYIRIECNIGDKFRRLSDGRDAKVGKSYWVAVEPIKWLVDEKANIALSKKILFAGVQFHSKEYNGDFDKTNIKRFMDRYFAKDIVPSVIHKKEEKAQDEYGFDYGQVSEEDIIKGAVESDVAVFIHGVSGDGKSSRVKQLDPDCEIIYMRNATPDSLNGKSVYNSQTGEMIDVAPSWYKRLKEKCEKEPDKIHILFFDELTNALPSVQGMAFNIILDGEVNGKWKLPKNARIVAAGNNEKDSLAANKMAEPLFNRFAHVYIKTNVETWSNWAITPDEEYHRLEYKEEEKKVSKIHPLIIAYVKYRGEPALRSEYNGKTPNADPRKWEMASRILYKTKKPKMLRALIGEELTQEFIEFCKKPILTLEDVLKGKYNIEKIRTMDAARKYVTTIGLTRVDEEHLEQVREVVKEIGTEYLRIFDQLWTHGVEERLERLAEITIIEKGRKK